MRASDKAFFLITPNVKISVYVHGGELPLWLLGSVRLHIKALSFV